MTFAQFLLFRDNAISARTCGMTADDFADAPWRDLYDDLGDNITYDDIYETLAEYDDVFRQMLAL